ncbi:hypothetical protein SK128_001929, partial [Halocaridina rubra]
FIGRHPPGSVSQSPHQFIVRAVGCKQAKCGSQPHTRLRCRTQPSPAEIAETHTGIIAPALPWA